MSSVIQKLILICLLRSISETVKAERNTFYKYEYKSKYGCHIWYKQASVNRWEKSSKKTLQVTKLTKPCGTVVEVHLL